MDTDLLAELIRSKHDCLLRLSALGAKQLELIRAGHLTALLDVLAAKQRALVQLQQAERAVDPFRRQDPEARRWRTPEERQACAEELRACEMLLVEIVDQEKQSERELVQRRDEAAVRLRGAHQAAHARGAYAGSLPHGSAQLDLTSET